MSWRCLLGHDWYEKAVCKINHFDRDTAVRPWKVTTAFLFQCKRCLKLKKIDMDNCCFNNHKQDDDDGDDKSPPYNSPISPDDYFEKLEKEMKEKV